MTVNELEINQITSGARCQPEVWKTARGVGNDRRSHSDLDLEPKAVQPKGLVPLTGRGERNATAAHLDDVQAEMNIPGPD
jgi:hypothetical protein